MWEQISEWYTTFITKMAEFRATDVLDILVVSFIIYNLIINPMYNPDYSKEDGIYNVYTYEHNFVFRAGVKYTL